MGQAELPGARESWPEPGTGTLGPCTYIRLDEEKVDEVNRRMLDYVLYGKR